MPYAPASGKMAPRRMESITLRNLEIARRYPLELGEDVPRRRRGDNHVCQTDGTPLRPAVLTTFGETGDPAVWRAHPIAIEGFLCGAGHHFEYAFLTPEEANELLGRGGQAARTGDLDLAEFCFRRVTSSWPGFAPGRVNLGSVHLDRVKVEQSRSAPPEEIRRLLDIAVDQFERALACTPPAPIQVRVMLARIYVRTDRAAKARPLLDSVLGDASASPELKEQARALASEAPAAPSGPRFAHAYLELAMPAGWKDAAVPDGLTAAFEGPSHAASNVVIGEAPAPCDSRALLLKVAEAHEAAVRGNHPRCDASPIEILDAHPTFIEVRRHFVAQPPYGHPWNVFARYVVAKVAVVHRDGRRVHPFMQLVSYTSVWESANAVVDAISSAKVLPSIAQVTSSSTALVPYFVTADHVERRDALLVQSGQKAEGATGLLTVAPGIHLTVAADTDAGVSPLFPADLAERGVSLVDALRDARRTIGARLGTPDLPCRTYAITPWAIPPIWRPGMHAVEQGTTTAKVMVVGPSWMAASTAASAALFERASEELGTDSLRMLIPHRDRAFVFACSEDEAANEALANGIVSAESDGAKPIWPKMFSLDAGGITPAGRRALQWTLLSSRRGATREELEAELPADDTWTFREGQGGKADTLMGELWRAPPFSLIFEFAKGGLEKVRVVALVVGDWSALEELDQQLRKSLPDVPLMSGDHPFELAKARPRIENRGSAQMRMAMPIQARITGFGDMFGQVFGAKRPSGEQAYGFDLGYQPGRMFLT